MRPTPPVLSGAPILGASLRAGPLEIGRRPEESHQAEWNLLVAERKHWKAADAPGASPSQVVKEKLEMNSDPMTATLPSKGTLDLASNRMSAPLSPEKIPHPFPVFDQDMTFSPAMVIAMRGTSWRSAGWLAVLVGALTLAGAPPLCAQEAWENKTISDILGVGFVRENREKNLGLTGLKKGDPVTREKEDLAIKELFRTGKFQNVEVKVEPDPADPKNKVKVTVVVVEYSIVEKVEFRGINEIPITTLKPKLHLAAGEPLNPYHLKQDREYIQGEYLQKGYHFSSVEESIKPGTTGVLLTWAVIEGPLVSVEAVVFTGKITVDESDLRRFIVTKENDTLLGIIPTGKNPFVERNLREDVERVKLYYRLEGWLDIQHGHHVFLEDLLFSEDKRKVTIKIHIEEGERYKIRNVRFEFDASSRRIFQETEMFSWLILKAGDPFTENNSNKDVARIREKYGERAYIQADVTHNEIVALDKKELDLVYSVKENDKIYVGRLIIEGNTKTREDVLRREFTRTGFLPGEEYNNANLQKAMQRVKDRQLVDAQGAGLQIRTQETDDPQTRDVVVEVKEGQTGNIRFAAGYSSSFGITGLIEFTQRNFDLADLPTSFDDLVGGTGFAGGGQFLRLRVAPSARRQSYTADFREPYVFGYEFGMGVRLYDINTLWESYDERRLGASVTLDKRFDPFVAQLTLDGYQIDIRRISSGAPLAIEELRGKNTVFSLTPALILDTRDSYVLPTSGYKLLISEQYAGQILPGSFDYNKFTFEAEGHLTLYETESHLKHVLSLQFTFGYGDGARQTPDVPIFERFYAGGRDRPRGFNFRGMGPRERGDPVGGQALVLATAEYSYPIFVEFLRGAVFYDLANLTPDIYSLPHEKWRNVVGVGIRFFIPQLGNIPVKLDFGFPLTKRNEDRRQTVTFDIGTLGF
jgi:outer membrane protein insertion porin family